MSCSLNKSCLCKPAARPLCKNYTPPKNSKYSRCARYIAGRVTCDLPKDACATCPFFVDHMPRPDPIIDWSDKAQYRKHKKAYIKAYRLRKKQAKLNPSNEQSSSEATE